MRIIKQYKGDCIEIVMAAVEICNIVEYPIIVCKPNRDITINSVWINFALAEDKLEKLVAADAIAAIRDV